MDSYQLRDIGLEHIDIERSYERSLRRLMLYADHGLPAPRMPRYREVRSITRATAPRHRIRMASRTLATWHERVSQRRLLASLDDRALSDVGLSRYDAEQEIRKPFWHE